MKQSLGIRAKELLCGVTGYDVFGLLASAAALLHLILTPTHVSALLLLENEICGFWMFMFVLFGLVAMFESSRLKNGKPANVLVMCAVLAVTCALGVLLQNVYADALVNQTSLRAPEPVTRALLMTRCIMAVYALSALGVAGTYLTGKLRRKGAAA